jgi:transposase
VTDAQREKLLAVVRRRPGALHLPFSWWTGRRLADHLAEQTGLRISRETLYRTIYRTIYRLLRIRGVHGRPPYTITRSS